ncbi:AAA family ATPase [Myxococcota bacterium]
MPRPISNFNGFRGKKDVLALVTRYLDGSRRTGCAFPSVLLKGPPGVGKSTLMQAISWHLGVAVQKVVAARDLRPADFYGRLVALEHGDIVLIDEGHNLTHDVQELLLGAAGEERRVQKMQESRGRLRTTTGETASIAEHCLAIATDRPGRISAALLARLPLKIDLGAYTDSEMRTIIHQHISDKRDTPNLSSQAITLMARAARGIPREAIQLIKLLHSYHPASDREVTKRDLHEFLRANKIDNYMLRPDERKCLFELHKQQQPMRMHHLARLVGVDRDYLVNTVEVALIRDRYIEVLASGRRLTAKGQLVAEELIKEWGESDGASADTTSDREVSP